MSEMVAGRYRLGKMIGSGGMADVYLAQGESGPVAVKRLMVESADAVRLLRAEAAMTAGLEHPALVRTVELVENFLVTEFVDGTTLEDHVNALDTLPPLETVLRWADELCDVLAYLHEQNVLYCDLKPANVLIDGSGRLRLIDFGLARMAKQQSSLPAMLIGAGTPGFAAPEQLAGAELSPRADVYALGATLFALLTRRAPDGSQPSRYNWEVSPILDMLVSHMMVSKAENRPELSEVRSSLAAMRVKRAVEGADDPLATLSPLRGDGETAPLAGHAYAVAEVLAAEEALEAVPPDDPMKSAPTHAGTDERAAGVPTSTSGSAAMSPGSASATSPGPAVTSGTGTGIAAPATELDAGEGSATLVTVIFFDIPNYQTQNTESEIRQRKEFQAVLQATPPLDGMAAGEYWIDTSAAESAAIVFFNKLDGPIKMALALQPTFRTAPWDRLGVRMGLHLGTVHVGAARIPVGAAINMSQRVASSAQPGHIMASSAYVEMLNTSTHRYVSIFGSARQVSVKHGKIITMFPVGDEPSLPTMRLEAVNAHGTVGFKSLDLVNEKDVTIGRGAGCEVLIDDPGVSRRHAVIAWHDGAWWLRHESRTNPTLVNGTLVSAEVRLSSGDLIQVSKNTSLRLVKS